MYKVLIVDDEPKVLEVVRAYLERDGFEVHQAASGSRALSLYRSENPDIIVLDLMLPDISGEEVCTQIRSESKVPILMLTAKSQEENRIAGITMGADDYLVKPFSPRELVVRIQAILRRTTGVYSLSNYMEFGDGDLVVDTEKRQVLHQGDLVSLTPIEYKLINLLAANPGRTFSRDELINHVLGYDYEGYDRTIDAHIKNLRQKIGDNPKNPTYIKTVFGMGYKFDGGVS